MKYHVCPFCETEMPGSSMYEPSRNDPMQCRSENACMNRLLKRHRAMKLVGAQMANVMYNLAQRADNQHADLMGRLWLEWDAARRIQKRGAA